MYLTHRKNIKYQIIINTKNVVPLLRTKAEEYDVFEHFSLHHCTYIPNKFWDLNFLFLKNFSRGSN